MFDKFTTFEVGSRDFEIVDSELIKTAAFKLPDGINYDPDFLYMRVRGVSAGEYWGANKNQDYFPEAELIGSYETFLTAHTFKNHENKDIKNAIGDVLHVKWNDKMKSVEILLRIDRKLAPTVVRGFEKGIMTDVSMGCRVHHSICSICGNVAKTSKDYCEHIKFMRGQILDDGRKVYEINIGPKFHDISAVLNGAERTAKAVNIMIVNNKVASTESFQENLEKVASYDEPVRAYLDERHPDKIASFRDPIDDMELDMNQFKPMSKLAYVQKIAEIKKEIQGKILQAAEGKFLKEREAQTDDALRFFHLFYDEFWDKDRCNSIACKIDSFAKKRNVPIEIAYHQFLKVMDFAGIELTPLEMHDITHALMKISGVGIDVRKVPTKLVPPEEFSEPDLESLNVGDDMNFESLFRTIALKVNPNMESLQTLLHGNGTPGERAKALVIRIRKPMSDSNSMSELLQHDFMNGIAKPMMAERSGHREYLIPRVLRVIQERREPILENERHFIPMKLSVSNGPIIDKVASDLSDQFAFTDLLYSKYQAERVQNYKNGSFNDGVMKFAEEIYDIGSLEKTAANKGYTKSKALLLGVPMAYAYSAIQKARINNGERVNDLNRAIAENPGTTALIQFAFGPMAYNGLKKATNKYLNEKQIDKLDDLLAKKFANEYLFGFQKTACVNATFDNTNRVLYNKDMFKDSAIDNELGKKYSQEQIKGMKMACVAIGLKNESGSNEILSKLGMTEDDVEEYLKTACNYIKMEIEKRADSNASNSGEIVKGIASDMLFNSRGVSAIATLPGNLIDSIVFNKLSSGAGKKNKSTISKTK